MTKSEINTLRGILNPSNVKDKISARLKALHYLDTVEITEEQVEGNYTGQQRNAAWLYMTHKVQQLNEVGLEMRKVLKPEYSIPWTKDSFHDHVWIPIQKALYGTDSMRSLKKAQVSKIHEVIEREMSEKHGVEYVPFPSDEARHIEELVGQRIEAHNNLSNDNYPEYTPPSL